MTIGRHVTKFSGYAAALPTPFDDNDFICEDAFERLCLLQIENGATALVVGGITGEAPNLSSAEHARLVKIAVRVSSRQVPVIADAGSNATAHAIELTKDAEVNGAVAVLSVVPYYNKPMQVGLYGHFREIAASTALPIILHDEPSRTALKPPRALRSDRKADPMDHYLRCSTFLKRLNLELLPIDESNWSEADIPLSQRGSKFYMAVELG
jgi:dihydrodipicolinate synthase/N-acetylneuraminate lyase